MRATHPLAAWAIEEVRLQGLTQRSVTDAAAVADSSFRNWKLGVHPGVGTLDAVLRVLGYRLEITPINEDETS